jgi:prepilin-type N-terminal cleavage/methylation domain-containing protein
MRAQRGFSLVEVLVGLLILAIVITTTISMFVERRRRIRLANETVLAYQVLSNEAELWRHFDFGALESEVMPNFRSDKTIIAPLMPYKTLTDVKKLSDTRKNVTLTVTWGTPKEPRRAKLEIVRCSINVGAPQNGPTLW